MKTIKTEIKWAVIFIIMTLAWMVLELLTGLNDKYISKHEIFTNFIAIPAIAVYVFALLDKRNNYYNGAMNYKQGFISGLIITAIITIFSPLTQFITSTIITPAYFTNVINYTVETGKMTRDAAEDFFNLKNYIIQGLIGAPVMGIITTAIVAYFVKRKN
jgi:hypothetical protein